MNSDQKLAKRYWEQKGDSLHLHQTEIRKDIKILLSKKYLMKKKFLVMKFNPQQWKKILAGATFVQIFLSNQQLTRHQSIFHRWQKQRADKECKFCCPFASYQVSFASQPSINVIVQEICPYSCRRSLLNAKVIKRSFYLKV